MASKNQQIMTWVKALPAVEGSPEEKFFLEAQRDKVVSLVDRADALTAQAAELRAEAYREGLRLESKARQHWTDEQIHVAQQASA